MRKLVKPGGLSLTVGKTQIRLDLHEDEDREADVSPIANIRFVAVEGEVLLHHTSETLLCLALAHLPGADTAVPDAPWLVLARECSFEGFKARVREQFLAEDDVEVRRAAMEVLFARHPAGDDEPSRRRLDEPRGTATLAALWRCTPPCATTPPTRCRRGREPWAAQSGG